MGLDFYHRWDMTYQLTKRIIGFFTSLALTLMAYFIITNPASFNLDTGMAIKCIFIFALVQSLVQLVCFIDVWHKKELIWNMGIFMSTISIIVIIIFFSIWIINHLNYNMG